MAQRRPAADGAHRERFYRSVAETLALLHAAGGRDRRRVLAEVVEVLATTMQMPLVWLGRLDPGQGSVEVVAASGPARAYAGALRLRVNEGGDANGGPLMLALRAGHARVTLVDAPEFRPWHDLARRYGLVSSIVAVAATGDGGHLSLSVYAGDHSWAESSNLADWAQKLVDELARFWDHQTLLERNLRLSRYRDAQRRIQRALLQQPDPDAVFRTLAEQLADVAGAAAVGVFVADDASPLLVRRALAGPLAAAMAALPTPTRYSAAAIPFTPTRAFMSGRPVVRIRPGSRDDVSDAWKLSALRNMGALGCWPFFAVSREQPAGVFAVATDEEDVFDAEMCGLFDELAEATGLALGQHRQRSALAHERERQTYFALHDPLTDLPNRRGLERHLEDALARAATEGSALAVGLLDLDDFKPVNDRHGHAVGDRVLTQVAARLRDAQPPGGFVARLGGDEFVLVLEGLRGEQDLDAWLPHIWQAVRRPLVVDRMQFQLSASLGLALYPLHATGSGDQLLRRADQAMYRVKSSRHRGSQWWSLPPPVHADADGADDAAAAEAGMQPYGPDAAAGLLPAAERLQAQLPTLIGDFMRDLRRHASIARLLEILPESDMAGLATLLRRRLRHLLCPRLDAARQRRLAAHLGQAFAASGLEEVMLLEAVEHLRDLVAVAFSAAAHRDRKAVGIVLQRLAMERQWQIESMRALQRQRMSLLAAINALAWSANSYLELMQGVVDILMRDPEVNACSVGRPDVDGHLIYEAVGGTAFTAYLEAVAAGSAAAISVVGGDHEGGGPTGRAWRSATIQRTLHYATAPEMKVWSAGTLARGVRSNAALPLCRMPQTPVALLTLYSPYPGGFGSDDQQAFLEQIKTVLDLALARLSPLRPGTQLLPFLVRDRWRRLLPTTALEMYFQPVVDLRRGAVAELEALARLRDEDGAWLLPGRFLPACTDDDLLTVFRQGLTQATACRQRLAAAGRMLDVAVNLPASALRDGRYLKLAEQILAGSDCPPQSVLLEILESPLAMDEAGTDLLLDARARDGMRELKALGLRLVEDDLGSGYSSLIRLRRWPFDRVKIDQALVRQVAEEPLQTLRFVRQLVRLGHDLGLEVVAEGLETRGLVEAAALLGADMGQGFALARPMRCRDLDAWFDGFTPPHPGHGPASALGALASAIVWEECLQALEPEPDLWTRFATASCGVGHYLERHRDLPVSLVHSHERLHAAAARGPADSGYAEVRDAFMALLVAQALREENRLRPRRG